MNQCHLCNSGAITEMLDFGPQPICNRFLSSPSEDEYSHPMRMVICESCGLVQLDDPVPASELLPRVDWITYNEPESHLDQLARTVAELPGLPNGPAACGISFKDDSLLSRLANLGFQHTWRLDPEKDLGISEAGAGVETVQGRITPQQAALIAQSHGLADVVVVRHIWEHAHDPITFIQTLKTLVKPDGYVVVEVPDCTRALESCDYSSPWEEHILYFTPESFKSGLAQSGLGLTNYASYPHELEDSLVAIVKVPDHLEIPVPSGAVLAAEKSRAKHYSSKLGEQQKNLKKFLSNHQENTGKVALLGAGHLACTFIDLLGVKDHIQFVVDDNPNKKGLFMPGSRLPILGSEALLEQDIKLCLLTVAPQVEDRVVENNQSFLIAGGEFHSIFPASKMALQI